MADLRYGKTGNKKRATCFATLLENELNSDVARFITIVRTCLATRKGGKTRNIPLQLVLRQCCKTSCTFFCCPFYRTFKRVWWKAIKGLNLHHANFTRVYTFHFVNPWNTNASMQKEFVWVVAQRNFSSYRVSNIHCFICDHTRSEEPAILTSVCYHACVARMQPALDGIYPLFQKRSLDQNYLLGEASLIAKVQIGKIVLLF